MKSSGTGRNSVTYLNTVVPLCEKGVSFNLESPTAITLALPEEVREKTRGFERLYVPTRRRVLRFALSRPPYQFPISLTSFNSMVTVVLLTYPGVVHAGG